MKTQIESLEQVLETLTELEVKALRAAWSSSRGSGHDFGFSEDVMVEGCNTQQNGALVSNLIKKGIIWRDDEFGQICFNEFEYSDKHDAAEAIKVWLDARDAKAAEVQPASDFQVESHNSVVLIRPLTDAAREWLDEHCPKDGEHTYYAGALVVEPRYLNDLLIRMDNDGLTF
jgi:hypothetical protein